jgi:hypothetical protein
MVHAGAIIGHGILRARDVKHEGEEVTVVLALMEGRKPEKVRPGAVVVDGATAVPRCGGSMVAHGVCSGFTTVDMVGGDAILMQDSTS